MKPRCPTCTYFDGGYCRRFPPHPGGTTNFPMVMAHDWCGEHPEFQKRRATEIASLLVPMLRDVDDEGRILVRTQTTTTKKKKEETET